MAYFFEELTGDYFIRDYELRPGSEFNDDFLHKGKNLYEVVRIIEQVPLFLKDHLERLCKSSEMAGYKISPDLVKISRSFRMLMDAEGSEEGNIKIVFHFGQKMGNTFFTAYFIPHHYPTPKNYRKGVNTSTLIEERPQPEIKNWRPGFRRRIKNLMALRNVYEVILINEKGYVTEGSQSNIFMIKGKTVMTAPGEEVLRGITRAYVLDICRKENIQLLEQHFSLEELAEADAVFLTGTSPKILPVARVDQIKFHAGNSLVHRIAGYYDDLIDEYIKLHPYEA